MNKELTDEIKRIIGNRFYENDHPFKYRSAGIEEFSQLLRLMEPLTDNEYLSHIVEIEKLFDQIRSCDSCSIKLCLFLMVLCEERFPDKFREYGKKFNELELSYDLDSYPRKKDKPKRNFKEEVMEAIQNYGASGKVFKND